MGKPWIGVMPLYDTARKSYWMLPGYFGGIQDAGGIPIMLPFLRDAEDLDAAAGMCDGFLLTGGHDVSPGLYGEAPLAACGEVSSERDEMEVALVRLAMAQDKPMLGICRGIQILNAALGGTLWQDLPTQFGTTLEHHQSPPYDRAVHAVEILPNTPLRALLGRSEIAVNSYHHQAVRHLSPKLRPMAVAPDGLVEAVYCPGQRFLWAVQWHPEFSYKVDENSRALFRGFVEECGLSEARELEARGKSAIPATNPSS